MLADIVKEWFHLVHNCASNKPSPVPVKAFMRHLHGKGDKKGEKGDGAPGWATER